MEQTNLSKPQVAAEPSTNVQTSVIPKTVGNAALIEIRVRHVGQEVLSPSRLRVANHSLIHVRSKRWPHARLKGIECL
jgi:hypothetical protein